jgi:hypothetical protein
MNVAEFLAWNPASAQRWQLVDGEPQAMAPANRTHGAIQAELVRLIANHLTQRKSPCSVVTAPGLIPRVRAETNFRIPDFAVTCSGYKSEPSALADLLLVTARPWRVCRPRNTQLTVVCHKEHKQNRRFRDQSDWIDFIIDVDAQ